MQKQVNEINQYYTNYYGYVKSKYTGKIIQMFKFKTLIHDDDLEYYFMIYLPIQTTTLIEYKKLEFARCAQFNISVEYISKAWELLESKKCISNDNEEIHFISSNKEDFINTMLVLNIA